MLPKMKRVTSWPMRLDWMCLVGGTSIKIETTLVFLMVVTTDQRKNTSRPSFPMTRMDEPAMMLLELRHLRTHNFVGHLISKTFDE
jgi:hypothetical protein